MMRRLAALAPYASAATLAVPVLGVTAFGAVVFGATTFGATAFAADTAPVTVEWPGGAAARPADGGALGGNVSGLAVDGASGLWAVRDQPGELLHLERSASGWRARAGGTYALRYPGGAGAPDAEAVTTAGGDSGAVYVGAERSNNDQNRSRNSILRYEVGGTGELTATAEWSVASIIGPTSANRGVEGLTWVPDTVLVAAGFRDASGQAYAPSDHAGHGEGLFAVAGERNGSVAFVALGDGGQVSLVARVDTGLEALMELSWNAERNELWALCDNACQGTAAVLRPSDGTFAVAALVHPPAGMGSLNDEGFAITPGCDNGSATAVWSDDSATGGTALREATLPCTPINVAVSPATTNAPATTLAGAASTAGGGAAPSSTSTSAASAGDTAATSSTDDSTPLVPRDESSSKGLVIAVTAAIAAAGLGAAAAAGAAGAARRRRRRPPTARP